MIYRLNDAVMYGVHGVCRITAITEMSFSGTEKLYYVLKPIAERESTIFIQTDNRKEVERMHPALTHDSAMEFILSLPDEEVEWIDDDPLRKETYATVFANADRSELISLIRMIAHRRTELGRVGKKMRVTDENFIRDAEKILFGELAFALEIPLESVINYISRTLNRDFYELDPAETSA